MRARLILWLVPGVLWLGFTFWYTDFGGPLKQDEIDEAMAYFNDRGMPLERQAFFRAFLEADTGRQFLMVNNIDMNETPPPMPGFEDGARADDYMNHYMEHMYRELLRRACHPVFMGNAVHGAIDLTGIEDAETWDLAALFRYRSRRTFLAIITNPDTVDRHQYKLAALTKTIAYPVEPSLYLFDPRLLLFLILGFGTALLDLFIFARRR